MIGLFSQFASRVTIYHENLMNLINTYVSKECFDLYATTHAKTYLHTKALHTKAFYYYNFQRILVFNSSRTGPTGTFDFSQWSTLSTCTIGAPVATDFQWLRMPELRGAEFGAPRDCLLINFSCLTSAMVESEKAAYATGTTELRIMRLRVDRREAMCADFVALSVFSNNIYVVIIIAIIEMRLIRVRSFRTTVNFQRVGPVHVDYGQKYAEVQAKQYLGRLPAQQFNPFLNMLESSAICCQNSRAWFWAFSLSVQIPCISAAFFVQQPVLLVNRVMPQTLCHLVPWLKSYSGVSRGVRNSFFTAPDKYIWFSPQNTEYKKAFLPKFGRSDLGSICAKRDLSDSSTSDRATLSAMSRREIQQLAKEYRIRCAESRGYALLMPDIGFCT